MIKVTIQFENKDDEEITVSARFRNFENIHPWMEKIKILNDNKVKDSIGFINKKELKDEHSSS